MAAVLGGQGGDERRPPARHEVMDCAAGTQAGEARVDEPELVTDPGHLVDLDVAGDMARARQIAGVVPAGRLQLGG